MSEMGLLEGLGNVSAAPSSSSSSGRTRGLLGGLGNVTPESIGLDGRHCCWIGNDERGCAVRIICKIFNNSYLFLHWESLFCQVCAGIDRQYAWRHWWFLQSCNRKPHYFAHFCENTRCHFKVFVSADSDHIVILVLILYQEIMLFSYGVK